MELNSVIKEVGNKFKWKNSCDRVTTGIYMLHKPIIVKHAKEKEVCYFNTIETIV